MSDLEFLDIENESHKPRVNSITSVIDPGIGIITFEDIINISGDYIDFVKFGWGTGYITNNIKEKIKILQKNNIQYWFGGTMFEISHIQNKLDEYCNFLSELECNYIEISDGSISLPAEVKINLIEKLSRTFTVISEIGSKDIVEVMSPSQWVEKIKNELDAGAWKVITEGRESGKGGIYRQNGEVRMGLVREIMEAKFNMNDLIFEAPNTDQQVWFLKNVGWDVNFGNIKFTDVINLQTLRVGLRGDTIKERNKL